MILRREGEMGQKTNAISRENFKAVIWPALEAVGLADLRDRVSMVSQNHSGDSLLRLQNLLLYVSDSRESFENALNKLEKGRTLDKIFAQALALDQVFFQHKN